MMNGFCPADVAATWADVSKAERWLGWCAQVAYDEGIRRLVAWYQANREWANLVEV